MKIKKWDTFKKTLESNNDDDVQISKEEKNSEEMIIKTEEDIQTEEELKDFFEIKK